jgi:hypothetical protein
MKMPTEQQPPRLTLKSTNPKDSIGVRKPRCYHVLSGHVQRLVSLAMMEGAMKYGSHNYRVAGVRASVYYDATLEHLDSYWEGETTDPDSGLPHVIKAIASLYVLADAIVQGKCEDDRPPNFVNLQEFKKSLQPIVDDLFRKYPNPVKGYTQKEIDKELGESKRNPDADMTAREAQNLDKLVRTQPTEFYPPGRCSSNDAMSDAIHSGAFDKLE